MIAVEPHFLVRAAALYVAVATTGVVWVWRRPSSRLAAGAMLAAAWNVPAVLVLHILAMRFDWWRYDAQGGLLLGMPVDLYLAWVWVWGPVLAIAFPRVRVATLAAAALTIDLILMPAATPVVVLNRSWLIGEACWLVTGLLPALLLARWTANDERLPLRAAMQVVAFSAIVLFVLPTMAIEGSHTTWVNPLTRPQWQIALIVQLLALPAVIGFTAVQEFATRGGGTPVPFDAPRRIVTTGIYAYLRSPMQVAGTIVLVLFGVILQNAWVAAVGAMAHVYGLGIAGWDEDDDLRKRFGDAWTAYRTGVRRWWPSWRPWYPPGQAASRLYVAASCDMCSEVGRWFADRGASGLEILPAECHPTCSLTRITYEHGGDGARASGVAAVARALEHVHFAWALAGCLLRLPVVNPFVQLIVDASGGEARRIPGTLSG